MGKRKFGMEIFRFEVNYGGKKETVRKLAPCLASAKAEGLPFPKGIIPESRVFVNL